MTGLDRGLDKHDFLLDPRLRDENPELREFRRVREHDAVDDDPSETNTGRVDRCLSGQTLDSDPPGIWNSDLGSPLPPCRIVHVFLPYHPTHVLIRHALDESLRRHDACEGIELDVRRVAANGGPRLDDQNRFRDAGLPDHDPQLQELCLVGNRLAVDGNNHGGLHLRGLRRGGFGFDGQLLAEGGRADDQSQNQGAEDAVFHGRLQKQVEET